MKRTILLFIILLTVTGFSQQFRKTATAGFVFLEIPVTARSAALGETSIALHDMNAEGIFSNPAIIGFTNTEHSFSTSYSPWFADIKNYAAAYTFNSAFGVIGVSAILFDFGSMPRTVRSGTTVYETIGTFDASALAVGLSYSRRLTDRFSFGVTLKYVRESIDVYEATNFLFDGGVLYFTGLGSFRIAAAVQNFGVDAQYINDPFKMPVMMRLGMAGEIFGDMNSEYRVTVSAEAIHPSDGDEKLNVGLETSWNNMVTLRGGYKFFYDEETYSFGLGLNPGFRFPVQFDVAYSDYGRLGNILRLTLQLGI